MRNLFFIVFAVLTFVGCSEDDHRIDISYTGEQLGSIQTPLGGIGTGSMVLNGCGGILGFDLLKSTLPEQENDLLSFFALHIAAEDNAPVVRLLERGYTNGTPNSSGGDLLHKLRIQGASDGNMLQQSEIQGSSCRDMLQKYGIQGFSEAVFHNAYPVVNIDLLDESVPLEVTMNAWSPLIPVDPLNSSLPAAVIEWNLVNPGRKNMAYSILFMTENLLNPVLQGDASHFEQLAITSHSVSGWEGITFSNYREESPGSESGAIRIMSTDQNNISVLHYSDRTDAEEHFKREFLTSGNLKNRGDDDSQTGKEPGVAAIHISGILEPGESVNIPFLFTWHIHRQIGEGQSAKNAEAKIAHQKAGSKTAEGGESIEKTAGINVVEIEESKVKKAAAEVAESRESIEKTEGTEAAEVADNKVKKAAAEVAEGRESIVEIPLKEVVKGKMENKSTGEVDATKEIGVNEKVDGAFETLGKLEVESANNGNLDFQRFANIDHISGYLEKEFEKLRKKTLQFSHAIITSTVPPGVVDTMMTDLAFAIEKQRDLKHFMLNPMDGVTSDSRGSSDTAPTSNDVGEKDDKARIAYDSKGSGDIAPTSNDVGEKKGKVRIAHDSRGSDTAPTRNDLGEKEDKARSASGSRGTDAAPQSYDLDKRKVGARGGMYTRGTDAALTMRGWDRYREFTGYSYEEEIQVMKISPSIDVLPVRCFWSTSTGWGTINISRAAIILECIHGSLDLKQLILEGRSFFVFREFVPSQDAFTSYSNEALRIAFPTGLSLNGGAAFRMEIP